MCTCFAPSTRTRTRIRTRAAPRAGGQYPYIAPLFLRIAQNLV